MDYRDLIDPLLKRGILTYGKGSPSDVSYGYTYPDDPRKIIFRMRAYEMSSASSLWKEMLPEDLPLWIAAHGGTPTYTSNSPMHEELITWAAQFYLEEH